jgi:hypothetical protein
MHAREMHAHEVHAMRHIPSRSPILQMVVDLSRSELQNTSFCASYRVVPIARRNLVWLLRWGDSKFGVEIWGLGARDDMSTRPARRRFTRFDREMVLAKIVV